MRKQGWEKLSRPTRARMHWEGGLLDTQVERGRYLVMRGWASEQEPGCQDEAVPNMFRVRSSV